MQVIEPVETMQLVCSRLIGEARTIRLVPTMGCLHDGHGSLIKRAIEDEDEEVGDKLPTGSARQLDDWRQEQQHHKADCGDICERSSKQRPIVVVSIFVNPLQFNDRDDFAKYPLTTQQDLALCERLKVDYVFMPKCRDIVGHHERAVSRKVSVISADGKSSSQIIESKYVTIRPPQELAQDLEGKSRQNHFEGMLTIVCKLFNIVQASRAYFGEKDFQQLVLVDKMVGDLKMVTKICAVETVREPASGLPLSSRNGRLSEEQKQAAAGLMLATLTDAKRSLEQRCRRSNYDDSNMSQAPSLSLDTILLGSLLAAQSCSSAISDEDQIVVDYLEVRCAKDLSVIGFDQGLGLYDCQKGCLRGRVLEDNNAVQSGRDMAILDGRILIAIVIGGVRLLDNIEVRLNL